MRFAPVIVALLLAGLVAWPFVRNMTGTESQGLPGAQMGGHLQLQSASGPFDSSALQTPLTLIYFGYTFCPDVCPVELSRMAQVMAGLGDRQHQVSGLFVTVDPERDTLEAVKAYARAFHPEFIGLTGNNEQIRQAMRQYQVYAQRVGEGPGYTVDHSSRIYLINQAGELVSVFAMETDVDAMVRQISALL